ncbi:MAG: hypothetical protein HZA30_05165 [Candidatus Omnitrophica bacterium]|nr:hypothetical protein [Candidatus Omnitrophota bacterium]
MKKLCFYLLIFAVLSWLSVNSFAAEHPGEHPGTPASKQPGTATTEHPGEHKEHPGTTHEAEHPGEGPMFSADEIIKGIKDHINKVTKANNGIFPLQDPVEGKSLNLKLQKVHEDKVSHIKKEDACFACTDFIADDGTMYDVDFWMKKDASGNLVVYDTKIHKKDGEPRFTYKDDEIVEVK